MRSNAPELERVQPRVRAALCEQLVVPPVLDDAAAVEHQDAVGMLHRGQPVRDHEHGAVLHQALECFLDQPLALGIQRRRGLVQQQDGRVPQQRAGDRQPLRSPPEISTPRSPTSVP
jgi:hypothetical protein